MTRTIFLLMMLLCTMCPRLLAQRGGEPVEVKVADLEPTPVGVSVTLRANNSPDAIHLLIGFTEGQAIVRAMRHEKVQRPQTHDLLKAVLDRNGWRVQRVLIRDLAGGTYFADMTLEKDGQTQVYDVRPSDAMAIGLRYDAKIYVNKDVFDEEKKGEGEQEKQLKPSEPDTLRL